jgi:arginyl-tRNA synthetase
MAAKSRCKPFVPPPALDQSALKAMMEDIHQQLGHDAARPPAFLTEDETAQIIHVSIRTLRNWRYAESRPLPWRKVGGATLYHTRDLAAFILTSTQGTPQ